MSQKKKKKCDQILLGVNYLDRNQVERKIKKNGTSCV